MKYLIFLNSKIFLLLSISTNFNTNDNDKDKIIIKMKKNKFPEIIKITIYTRLVDNCKYLLILICINHSIIYKYKF